MIRPEQFVREHLNYVISDVNRHLIDLCETVNPSFLEVSIITTMHTVGQSEVRWLLLLLLLFWVMPLPC